MKRKGSLYPAGSAPRRKNIGDEELEGLVKAMRCQSISPCDGHLASVCLLLEHQLWPSTMLDFSDRCAGPSYISDETR